MRSDFGYVWPSDDDAYMKMIRKTRPDGFQFRILGSRFHPIGDFDSPNATLPDEPARVYQTANGLRVFFVGRYGEPPGSFLEELVSYGGDPTYARICRARGYYACRVDPKTPTFGEDYAVTRLLGQTGEARPEWAKFIEHHDDITNALATHATLV